MSTMKRASVCVLCLSLLLASAAWAGPFKAKQVSAKAKWAVHMDVEGIVSSRLGKLFLGIMEEEGEMEELDEVTHMLGMDPKQDLYGVTVYGTSFEEEAVVLLHGNFKKDKLIELLDKETDYDETQYGDYTIYDWKEGRDRLQACFHRKNLIVFSNSSKRLKEAIKVLNGEAESLDDDGKLGYMDSAPDDSLFVAAAWGFGSLAADVGPEAQILQKAEKVLLAAGESEGSVFVDAALYASDGKTAQQVHDVLRGLISLGAMLGDQEPELAQLNKILSNARLEQDGKMIRFRHALPVDDLIDLLKCTAGL